MHEPSYAFLKRLLTTPSPSGFERQIQDVVRAWAKPLAIEVRTDRHGNVLAVRHPDAGKGSADHARVMLAVARTAACGRSITTPGGSDAWMRACAAATSTPDRSRRSTRVIAP